MNLRPYQIDCVNKLLAVKRGICHSPAGAGKTMIAAAAVAQWHKSYERFKPRINWLAATREQCEQAKKALAEVGPHYPVCVGCYAGATDLSQENLLIVDECHHASAEQLGRLIESCRGIRWGFSATPFCGDKTRDDRVRELLGDVVCSVDRSKLIENGHLLPARVSIQRMYGFSIEEWVFKKASSKIRPYMDEEQRNRVRYQAAYEIGIKYHEERNLRISSIAQLNKNSLILVRDIEHAEILNKMILDSFVCTARLPKKKRASFMDDFRAGQIPTLILTSLADEGLDLPIAGSVILAGGGRSSTKTEQRTGRVLRVHESKTHGTIYDFDDSHHPMLARHARERQAVYKKLNYQVIES